MKLIVTVKVCLYLRISLGKPTFAEFGIISIDNIINTSKTECNKQIGGIIISFWFIPTRICVFTVTILM